MRLESIQSAMSAEFRKVDGTKKSASTNKAATYTRASDKTSLSSDARGVSEQESSARVVAARIDAEPEVRADKISEIRQKLDDGFYNSSQFADQLADKLIKDFGF